MRSCFRSFQLSLQGERSVAISILPFFTNSDEFPFKERMALRFDCTSGVDLRVRACVCGCMCVGVREMNTELRDSVGKV